MSAKNLLLGLLSGLMASLVLLSSFVAFQYQWAPELGAPLAGWFYDPRSVLTWWRWWSGEPAFMHEMKDAALMALLPLAAGFCLFVRPSQLKPGDRHKDGGLGTIRDLKRTGFIGTKPGRLVLGDDGRGNVLSAGGDKHCLVLGPSGSAKDVGHIIPSLLLDRGSALVFDPKRELDQITARRRREFGEVHVLDLADPKPDTAAFNVFDTVRKDFDVEDCAGMAQLVAYQHGDDTRGGKAGPWNAACAKMLTAGFLHVNASGDRTLGHVRRWVQKVIEGQYLEPNHEMTAAAIVAHEALPNETRGGVNFNLDTATSFISYGKSVEKVTGRSTFDPADLMCGKSPMTVYLTVPTSHRKALRGLQRLMLGRLIHPLMLNQFQAADGRPKLRPMTLHASEFTTMGKLDLFDDLIKDLRGFGFRYVLSTQGVEDIYDVYGENNPILVNSQIIVAIPGFGKRTSEYLMSQGGKKWIASQSHSRKPGFLVLPTRSESEQQVDAIDVAMLRKRELTQSLVLVRGVMPTWVKRVIYSEHPAFSRMYDQQPGSELLRG